MSEKKSEFRVSPSGRIIREPKVPLRGASTVGGPMALPLGMTRPLTLQEQMAQFFRSAKIREELDAAGYETFEEADDFDVGDDFDPSTP